MTGPKGRSWYGAYGKAWLDRVLAGILLVALAPLLALVTVLVRRSLGSPVFFGQHRPGLGGRPFRLVKFRTMRDARDGSGRPLPDADRLTPFGRTLREWSVDELPELINVLRGEMSLVGPRPLLMDYLPRYTPEQARRHEVRPGLTGWAQVNGRNALSWEERFALDVWYVDHVSLMLDLRILALTIRQVVRREGISHATHATMHEFRGTGAAAREHRGDDKETAPRGA